MKEIYITGDYIQLDQFLKKENVIGSGGEAGLFITSHTILLDGKKIMEKRKKLYPGQFLSIDNETYKFRSKEE